MLAGRLPSGRGPPARNLAASCEPLNRRGVWQSAQCAAPPARYSPRSGPPRGASFGAGPTRIVGVGILSDRAGTDDLIGLTLFRHATSARTSSSALLAKYSHGRIGNSLAPSGRPPRRIA